jgi:hypothetical protein
LFFFRFFFLFFDKSLPSIPEIVIHNIDGDPEPVRHRSPAHRGKKLTASFLSCSDALGFLRLGLRRVIYLDWGVCDYNLGERLRILICQLSLHP